MHNGTHIHTKTYIHIKYKHTHIHTYLYTYTLRNRHCRQTNQYVNKHSHMDKTAKVSHTQSHTFSYIQIYIEIIFPIMLAFVLVVVVVLVLFPLLRNLNLISFSTTRYNTVSPSVSSAVCQSVYRRTICYAWLKGDKCTYLCCAAVRRFKAFKFSSRNFFLMLQVIQNGQLLHIVRYWYWNLIYNIYISLRFHSSLIVDQVLSLITFRRLKTREHTSEKFR